MLQILKALIGREIGVSDWLLVDQSRIDQFADATDDHQWIHVDVERAAHGPFGATIAHGFLTLALLPALGESIALPIDRSQVALTINYGLNQVRFITPVPVNSRIRSRVTLANVEEKPPGRILVTYRHTVEIEGQAKPACVAEALMLLVLRQGGET